LGDLDNLLIARSRGVWRVGWLRVRWLRISSAGVNSNLVVYVKRPDLQKIRAGFVKQNVVASSRGFGCELRRDKVKEELLVNLEDVNVKPITFEQYQRQVLVHISPALGHMKLGKLTPGHVQGLYQQKLDAGMASSSVRYMHTILHGALKQAHKWRFVPENVAAATTPPKPQPKEIRPLDSEQTKTLLEAARSERLEALFVVAVTAGLRIGELLGLRWEDIDLERGIMRVARTLSGAKSGPRFTTPKNGKGRTIMLTRQAVEVLRSHRKHQNEERLMVGILWEDYGLVFPSTTGRPLSRNSVDRRCFKPLLRRAGLPSATRRTIFGTRAPHSYSGRAFIPSMCRSFSGTPR
jgi:integrase